MPNGKPGDNPLTDFSVHGRHPFPDDIEALLDEIRHVGAGQEMFPLGQDWPFSPSEFAWERGEQLEDARRLLPAYLEALREGRASSFVRNWRAGSQLP